MFCESMTKYRDSSQFNTSHATTALSPMYTVYPSIGLNRRTAPCKKGEKGFFCRFMSSVMGIPCAVHGTSGEGAGLWRHIRRTGYCATGRWLGKGSWSSNTWVSSIGWDQKNHGGLCFSIGFLYFYVTKLYSSILLLFWTLQSFMMGIQAAKPFVFPRTFGGGCVEFTTRPHLHNSGGDCRDHAIVPSFICNQYIMYVLCYIACIYFTHLTFLSNWHNSVT